MEHATGRKDTCLNFVHVNLCYKFTSTSFVTVVSQFFFKTFKNLDWDNDVIDDYNYDLSIMKMDELKTDLNHSKDYKLYKVAWIYFIICKDIDELDDDELKLLYSYDFIPFKKFPKPIYPDGF